ncbi:MULTISPECIES: AI-2E family transporter [unclassified Granulicatella]|jgi:transport protein|uniref:AI-2E family transporter n=1 Tax=unclassified Granulicatella TaxID=2630493 RepID=UPI00066E876E|nr:MULTISPECIES: AI-2E family transporter [unclassified Granulicatella]
MDNKPENQGKTWFWRWFLDNQLVSGLLILSLLLINLILFSQTSYLFNPLKDFISAIGVPVACGAVIYYLVKPIYDYLLNKKVPKGIAILLVMVGVIVIFIMIITSLVPIIQKQLLDLVSQLPYYYQIISEQVENFMQTGLFETIQEQFNKINTDFIQSITERLNGILNFTFSGIGSVVGIIGDIVITVMTMPVILYYLLKDGNKVIPFVTRMFPTRSQHKISVMLNEMNQQVSSYIRGQITVAICVGFTYIIGYTLIGLPYGVTIGMIAGLLTIIPYLGSLIGLTPALIIGFVTNPTLALHVFLVFVIEQLIESRVLQPLILGSSLKMHPVTILIILLAAGKMFGLVGLLIAVPVYAVVKVFITHFFAWYKEYSGLYYNDKVEEVQIEE